MHEQISTFQQLINTLVQFFVNYSFQVIGAVIILIAGFFLAKWTGQLIIRLCKTRHVDIALAHFLANCGKATVLAFAIIIAMGKFGITIAPFVAALGAIAFGSTMAIQGPLSNYGAGLSIILSRSFTIGDTINVAGVSGIVQDVTLANTVLINEEGVKITIPNKDIVGQIVQNSAQNRVVDGMVGISYSADVENTIQLIGRVLTGFNQNVAANPAPLIGIQQFGESAIIICYRYWTPTAKHIQVSHAVNLAVYKALKGAGVEIPFPQREVRIISQTNNARV